MKIDFEKHGCLTGVTDENDLVLVDIKTFDNFKNLFKSYGAEGFMMCYNESLKKYCYVNENADLIGRYFDYIYSIESGFCKFMDINGEEYFGSFDKYGIEYPFEKQKIFKICKN